MPDQIFSHTLARIAICTATLAITVLDARAADELLKYPDLSGRWGRDMLFFEPTPSGRSHCQLSSQGRRKHGPAGRLLWKSESVGWRSYQPYPQTRRRGSRQEV